jgi:hypothetical protein
MGFLPQFENDIFISYRHVSNEGQYRWVDIFCDKLGARLKELIGDVTMWRDLEKLRAAEPWRPEVIRALDQAAIFLAIMSRTYLDSDECRKELDRFLGKLKESQKGRKILPIFKQPLRVVEDLPPEVEAIHAPHRFYRQKGSQSDDFDELVPDSQDYWLVLEMLAKDIMRALEKLKGDVRQDVKGKVFIASVAPELSMERELLRTDLQHRGYDVVPEKEYMWNSSNFLNRITTDIENAQLCIHLVSPAPSYEPESVDNAKQQLSIALDMMKRQAKAAPLVWIKPSNTIDITASQLTDYIKNQLANEGVEYQQGGFENFKTLIFDNLLPIQSLVVAKIALMVEQNDVSHAGYVSLRTLLVNKLECEPIPVKFNNTIPADAARCDKTLSDCASVVIFWANQSEEWILDLLADLDYRHLSQDKVCIYIVGPQTAEKSAFKTARAHIIQALNDSNESELQAFLKPGCSRRQ